MFTPDGSLDKIDLFWRSGPPRFDPGILMGWLLHSAGRIQWFPVAPPYSLNQIPVHLADKLKRYLLGAHGLALAMIRATTEVFIHHRDYHRKSPLITLGLTLRKGVKVS